MGTTTIGVRKEYEEGKWIMYNHVDTQGGTSRIWTCLFSFTHALTLPAFAFSSPPSKVMHLIIIVQGIGRPALQFLFTYCPKMTLAFSVNALPTHFSNTLASNTPWFTKNVSCRSSSSNCSFRVRLPMIVAKMPPTEWMWFYIHMYEVIMLYRYIAISLLSFFYRSRFISLLPPPLFCYSHHHHHHHIPRYTTIFTLIKLW